MLSTPPFLDVDDIVYKELLTWATEQCSKSIEIPKRLAVKEDGTLVSKEEFEENLRIHKLAVAKHNAWADLLLKLYEIHPL